MPVSYSFHSKKYRKKQLYGQIKADVREIIGTLCKYKDVEIIAGAVCEDHVHLSVAIPPKISISSFIVRRHIVGGANRTLISASLPLRLCCTGTCRRLQTE